MIYPLVIIPVIVGIITQSLKFLLSVVRHNKIEFKYLFTSGHMPSSHTAFVISLVIVMAIEEGIDSSIFAVSFVFAHIVIYDAIYIRANIGNNGMAINKLVKEASGIKKHDFPILRERVGHTPSEVLVGGILGIILTLAFMFALENI